MQHARVGVVLVEGSIVVVVVRVLGDVRRGVVAVGQRHNQAFTCRGKAVAGQQQGNDEGDKPAAHEAASVRVATNETLVLGCDARA